MFFLPRLKATTFRRVGEKSLEFQAFGPRGFYSQLRDVSLGIKDSKILHRLYFIFGYEYKTPLRFLMCVQGDF